VFTNLEPCPARSAAFFASAAFFDLKQGLNFDLKVTNTLFDPENSTSDGTPETIRVVCDNYNLVYLHDTAASIQATLRRVYEPS